MGQVTVAGGAEEWRFSPVIVTNNATRDAINRKAAESYADQEGTEVHTGGKDAFTQQAHGEFIVSSETKCPPNTQQAHGEYF